MGRFIYTPTLDQTLLDTFCQYNLFCFKLFKLALHWILAKEPESKTLPIPLIQDLLTSEEYINANDPRTWLRRQLTTSPEKVVEVAFATTGQRENAMWSAIRKMRFTASNFGNIIGAANRKR